MASRVRFEDNCLVAPQPTTEPPPKTEPFAVPALLLAFVPILADLVISGVKTYIERAKNNLTANYVVTGSSELFDKDGNLTKRCLTIVRGVFGSPMANPASSVGSLTADHLERLGLVTYPELYFEAWLSPVPGEPKGRIRVQPQVLHFAKTAAKRSDTGEKFIGMMLAFIDAAPDPGAKKETVEEKALATIPFEFTKVRVGSEYRAVKEDTNEIRNPLADQTKVITIQRGDKIATGAINLYAFVTETEDASPFYQLLIDSITGHKDTLSKAIEDAVTNAINKSSAGGGKGGGTQ
jgi:hypothetical protein